MVLSGVFFFNNKGEILISRVYRDDITKHVAEVFRLQVVGAKDVRSPIKTIVHTHIIHIKVHYPVYRRVAALTRWRWRMCM